MQQIAEWLDELGMSEYTQRFAENGIDFTVLSDLTDQDLKDIGVLLGHRRKLLRAIAELKGVEKGEQKPAPPAAVSVAPQDIAERRQVTVLFSDLVGSTALSARMDPEDLREVISTYQKCVAATVQRFAGFVAKYMGDGVLVYFGYPLAHEDDAERAVRAGLELVAAVNALKAGAALQTRVGIATGLVIVGDLIGAGESQERGIVGETATDCGQPLRFCGRSARAASEAGHAQGQTADRPASFNSFSQRQAELDEKLADVPHWTLHDLRRTARSLMAEAGVAENVAERVLGHALPGVRGVYNRYDYADEKADALQRLAAKIETIVNPPSDNVASFAR